MEYVRNYEEQLFLRTNVVGFAERYKENIIKAFRIDRLFAENKIKKYNNCKEALQEKGKISIQKILEIYWPQFVEKYKKQLTRAAIIENVEAVISCGKFDSGYLYFECENPCCNNFHLQPFTCKSRFCPSCGKKYNDARVKEISKKCINVKHRHIVFTISNRLWPYFQKDRSLIDCLFEAVNQTFNFMAKKVSKLKEYKFGFISTLHTFGRDIKFNPHLHVLVAECIIDKNNNVKKYDYFHYELMRKSFQKILLDLLTKRINTVEFRHIKNLIYKESNQGFYVYGPSFQAKDSNESKELVRYVVRYAGHPAISQGRITNVDFNNHTISFYYDPHEDLNTRKDNKIGRQYVTEHIFDFIKKLIVHIPDTGKHNIRYYGFYANKSKQRPIIRTIKWPLYPNKVIRKMIAELSWRNKILKSFNYDILMCDRCGNTLILVPDMCYIPKRLKRKRCYG